jgi:Epoxide hydrolase N terminus
MSDEVTPFRIEVPEPDLRDLHQRLKCTRWPEAETVKDWSQGDPLAYLQEFCRYWADTYDWRATEAWLNALPQFRTGSMDSASTSSMSAPLTPRRPPTRHHAWVARIDHRVSQGHRTAH